VYVTSFSNVATVPPPGHRKGRPADHVNGEPPRQRAAFLTSATILASPVAVNSFNAKATGHMAPASRFALSLKPNVEYLVLNFCAPWKKQTTKE
jgi:hypothetical protein